ncbi:MAG TPA: amidohydrolase family protein [Acidimicrobiales bacterium]
MGDYDLIIRGGRICDGTGLPSFVGDLAVSDGKVAKIDGLRRATAERELDAEGLVVAPGFVDLHTHYDAQVFWDPYCSISGWHGVTSVVMGNCGFGFAPVRPEDRERAMLMLTRNEQISLEAMRLGIPWDWETFPEFLDSLDRLPKAVNCTSLTPLTPLMSYAMGGIDESKTRKPTTVEVEEMKRLLHVAMDAGACGFSLQKLGENSMQADYDGTPMITDTMDDELILEFGSVLAERGEGFVQLTYAPLDSKLDLATVFASDHNQKFVEELAAVSGRPVLHNAIQAIAVFPDAHRGALAWLESANRNGHRVLGQADHVRNWYEFTFEDFSFADSAPSWRDCLVGEPGDVLHRLADPEIREQMRNEEHLLVALALGASIPKFTLTATGGTSSLDHYVGRSMADIAETEGRHHVDVLLDIALDSKLKAEFKSTFVKEPVAEYNAEILKSPYTMAGISDGGAHTKFFIGGAYPTDMIRWLVREEGLLTLEEAHMKLSYLPAHAAGLTDRGFLREGFPADIVVYDYENLAPEPDFSYEQVFDLPGGDWRRIQRANGYRWVLVNGEITIESDKETDARPGRLLRHGRG